MAAVYLETTIPSYLTAWRTTEIVMAARQQITQDWWDNRRHDFELFISQLVIDEASAGDADAVVNGMDFLLTWNCTHIANASLRPRIDEVCKSVGYQVPVICTPEELMMV